MRTGHTGFRLLCFMVCLVLCLGVSSAQALVWPASLTASQSRLAAYIQSVNQVLDKLNGEKINSVFECYDTFASLGVTSVENADSCESVEIVVQMSKGSLDSLQLAVSDTASFATLCAALTSVAANDPDNAKTYLKDPQAYVKRVQSNPLTSFEDRVMYDRGDRARTYYAYTPDAFGDGKSYLTMTLIFPRETDSVSGAMVTPVPSRAPESVLDGRDDDGDYTPYDEGVHFEVFVTATPEPDSAAGDEFYK